MHCFDFGINAHFNVPPSVSHLIMPDFQKFPQQKQQKRIDFSQVRSIDESCRNLRLPRGEETGRLSGI